MEYYLVLNRKEIILDAAMLKNLEDIMLSGINQSQKENTI
jgi:hypothetical protein